MKLCLLIYDIPQRAEVANPSRRLRRVAVRVNLSCWVLREESVPYHLLHDMAEGGASWHVVAFDAAEAEKITAIAAEALRREVAAAVRRTEKALDRAAEQTHEPGETPAAFARRCQTIIRRAEMVLEAYAHAAGEFGLTGEEAGLYTAWRAVGGLQVQAQARAALYAQLAAQAGPLAEVARRDEIPAEVLMDYVEERGGDTEAAREAFAP